MAGLRMEDGSYISRWTRYSILMHRFKRHLAVHITCRLDIHHHVQSEQITVYNTAALNLHQQEKSDINSETQVLCVSFVLCDVV